MSLIKIDQYKGLDEKLKEELLKGELVKGFYTNLNEAKMECWLKDFCCLLEDKFTIIMTYGEDRGSEICFVDNFTPSYLTFANIPVDTLLEIEGIGKVYFSHYSKANKMVYYYINGATSKTAYLNYVKHGAECSFIEESKVTILEYPI